MFGKFLPRETNFFDFFEQHAVIIVQASKEFLKLASSETFLGLKDPEKFKKFEHQADILVHNCVEALHKTFITSIDREDILRLISSMDNIIDGIDATFDCLVVYRIEKPTPELRKMAEILFQASEKIVLIVQGLRNMDNAQAIRDHCNAIRQLEHEGDDALLTAIGNLFDGEQDTRAVIKMKEIYENLEDAIDGCHTVANIIEGIVLESV
jgi:uncharacterized protein Yka (UPF0111/DUF47 family)